MNGMPSLNLGLGDIQAPATTLDEIFRYLEQADKPCLIAIDEFQQIAGYAEKNVEGTFQVVRQLLENVESIGDFSGSKLYRHLQFKKNARWNADELREKLLEGFRDETEFSYMKGYEPWEKLVSK